MIQTQLVVKAALLGSLSFSTVTSFAVEPVAPKKVDTEGLARTENNVQIPQSPQDHQIATRIQRILAVTGWYPDVEVTSREGVVTLKGQVSKSERAQWAEDLAHDTEGVVAVLNDLQVQGSRMLDLKPAREETENLARRAVAFLPYLVTAGVIMLLFSLLAMFNGRIGRRVATRRLTNPLLVEIVSRLFALPVILLGLYLVLRVFGLTGIAVTVLGGTGAIGLIMGFAMKGILENYFAGVLLSLRNPYTVGDVIDVAGKVGVVRELTTRGTILVDFDGNHIIIPNSTIYQNVITNLSANPSTRIRFMIGIGYQDDVGKARDIILDLLATTEGILTNPEPLVLVEDFSPGSIMFGVYFWIEPKKTNGGKLKSQVMENVKIRLQEKRFTLPRDLKMVAFPDGIPIPADKKQKPSKPHAKESSQTEISSDTDELLREAQRGRPIDHGDRLI